MNLDVFFTKPGTWWGNLFAEVCVHSTIFPPIHPSTYLSIFCSIFLSINKSSQMNNADSISYPKLLEHSLAPTFGSSVWRIPFGKVINDQTKCILKQPSYIISVLQDAYYRLFWCVNTATPVHRTLPLIIAPNLSSSSFFISSNSFIYFR